MDEARESDLFEAHLDLIDMSEFDENTKQTDLPENDSVHQASTSSKGFCVKEYEEQMDKLQKDNFKLKFEIFFLKQNNATLPEGFESFLKQLTDLKSENESLRNDLKEKQDLLQQASIALELLDEEKSNCLTNAELTIEELNNKVKLLEQERTNLQHALNDLNKSNLGNDTGYADFLGAVDMRDIEMQRKIMELNQVSEEYKQQVTVLNEEIQKYKHSLSDSESKLSALKYERDELSEKFKNSEAESKVYLQKYSLVQEMLSIKNQDLQFLQYQNERYFKKIEMLNEKCEGLELLNLQISLNSQHNPDDFNCVKSITELKNEVTEFKEKWAATQYELLDTEAKLKESEDERTKTVSLLTKSLESFDEERQKVLAMEKIIAQKKSTGIDEKDTKKDEEISRLKAELDNAERKLRVIATSEVKEKNQEIEKLTKVINEMKISGNKSIKEAPRFSLDHLYDSFNDLKFQQAMEVKKQSQKKVNDLMNELVELANSKTIQQVNQLKEQLAIVAEKQEVADDALNRCAELCSYTLDHLNELAQFLTTLLQNKEIRESLSNQSLLNIQNILDKSVEFSRYSIDGRISGLDLSVLGSLINTARDSIANIREKQIQIMKVDKSIQIMNDCENCLKVASKLQLYKEELEELKSVNQLLEDEICEYREIVKLRDTEIQNCHDSMDMLKNSEMEIAVMLEECHGTIQSLQVEKINLSSELESSQQNVQKLEKRLKEIEDDLDVNWITKIKHDDCLKKIKDDVVNAESQTAAIRIELEEIRNMFPKYKLSSHRSSILDDFKENCENACAVTTSNLQLPEISDDKYMEPESSRVMTRLEYNDENHHVLVSAESTTCKICPKYQAQIRDLKKCLKVSVEKLKNYSDLKAQHDRQVQQQLNKTENFLQQARFNMENIIKDKGNNK